VQKLNLAAFPGASNWPLWVGLQRGYFKQEDIDLRLSMTPNSRQLARDLFDGTVQIAMTSMDNVIAYTEGQGEEPLGAPADFFAFMGLDDGLLSLLARPEYDSVRDLEGKTLAVDALTTGFAFVLREILADAGLKSGAVTFAAVGTGAQRRSALLEGACDATLLNAPICLTAENAGMSRLIYARDVIGEYQGIVSAARRSWAAHNKATIQAFIRGFQSSLHWMTDPANKAAACTILTENLTTIAPVIDQAYAVLVANGGLRQNLKIDHHGVEKVIILRNRYGVAPPISVDPAKYIDDALLKAAIQT